MVETVQKQKKGRTVVGTVISSSGAKSIKVVIDYKVKHPRYGKYVRRKTTFGVHDEHEKAGVGDLVEIVECRPFSKTKSWRLVKILMACGRDKSVVAKEHVEK